MDVHNAARSRGRSSLAGGTTHTTGKVSGVLINPPLPADRPLGPLGRAGVLCLVVLAPLVGAAGGLDPQAILPFLAVLPYAIVGGFLAILRPRNTVSWLIVALAWAFALAFINVPATTAQLMSGTASTGATAIAIVQAWAGGALMTLFLAVSLLFPSGRLPGGRPGTLARCCLLLAGTLLVLSALTPTISVYPSGASQGSVDVPNPLAVSPALPLWPLMAAAMPILFGLLLVGLASMFVRSRRASGVERAQLRWLVWSLAFLFAGILIGLVGDAIFRDGLGGLVWLPAEIGFVLPPFAIGIAILRYRLYEIDVLINRTAVYGLVTALLVVPFGAAYLILQRLAESLTGQHSDLVALVVVGGAAVTFNPLRRRVRPLVDRVLPSRAALTLLFTDIVSSTRTVAELGDERWRAVLERYLAAVRGELSRFRGHEVNTAGDAFFATFERPAEGLACAWAIRSAVRQLGLETRTGLHVGEVEMRGEQPSGLAVHTAARVMAAAKEGEILVSNALREALTADDLALVDRGRHELRGVPGEWQLYAAEPGGAEA